MLKTATAGQRLEVEMPKKCKPFWREAHAGVKMYKAHQPRTTFGSCNVEKVHAVTARVSYTGAQLINQSCWYMKGVDVRNVARFMLDSKS